MIDASDIDAMAGDARLETDQGDHTFGDVTVEQSSALLSFVVLNVGESASSEVALSVEGANAADFEIVPTGDTNDCAGITLDPQGSCTAQVRFRPTVAGARAGTLRVEATSGGAITVAMTGNGLSPGNLEITAGSSLAFGNVEIASQSTVDTITVRNNGQSATASLTVSVSNSSSFTAVTDSCGGSPLAAGSTCQVAMRFNPLQVGSLSTQVSIRESATVGVSASGTGAGTARLEVGRGTGGSIASSPSGINCGSGCPSQTATFSQTPVTLTATPDAGYVFDGWTGACAASQSPICSVALTVPLSQTAAAFQQVFTLDVSRIGSGTVAGTGINCGSDCMETYDAGTTVVLTAEPADGFEVYSWSGTGTACGAGLRMCSVPMTQARNVTVEFRRQHTVTVSKDGSGSGTVSGGAINCGGTCSALVFENTSIVLSQLPSSAPTNSQNIFSAWGAPCSGSGATCTVTPTANVTITATFTLQHRLSATIAGTGTGSVSTTPSGLSCSSGTCNAFFNAGSTVAIAATAGGSTAFDGFSGDCSGTTCSVVMGSPRAVTATFRSWECTPSTTVCNDATDVYVECSADGRISSSMNCPLGCNSTVEKCDDVNPSNGLATYLDMASTGPDVTFTGTSTINTTDGTVFNAGLSQDYPNALVSGIRVFWFDTLNVNGSLTISGNYPVALVVNGDVSVTALIDISANTDTGGPGGNSCSASNASNQNAGGGGGGRYVPGAAGGLPSGGGAGGSGGTQMRDDDVEPLIGGCRGGTVAFNPPGDIAYARGGGGGGAIQIVSRTLISFGATGVIDASGGGGGIGCEPIINGCTPYYGGGGGGSGGAILLEAPDVLLNGASVVLSTKGGGGAAGMTKGSDGSYGVTAAAGGTWTGHASGGSGATTTSATSVSTPATVGGNGVSASAPQAGGGGGSVGQTRFNTSTGQISPQNSPKLYTPYSTGLIDKRQVP